MMKWLKICVLLLFAVVNATWAAADDYHWNLDADGITIYEHDAVAYFTLPDGSDAVKGKKEFSYQWEDGIWYFANAENLATFKADPTKYIPQYGGFCAYAAARGYFAPIDPDAWSIENGKLYLNYSKRIRNKWLKNVDAEIASGDANWPDLQKP